MNFIISLVYAPLVFFSLKSFDIKIVSLSIFFISLIWFLYSIKKDRKESYFPLIYILFAIFTFYMENFILLKILPTVLSFFICILMFISYKSNESIILHFIEKFTNFNINENEKAYIHKSTIFWILISLINTIIHLIIFFIPNINFWIYYTSIGWYILFILAGFIQYIHRKYFFLKKLNV